VFDEKGLRRRDDEVLAPRFLLQNEFNSLPLSLYLSYHLSSAIFKPVCLAPTCLCTSTLSPGCSTDTETAMSS
jgi:hypothetical protein